MMYEYDSDLLFYERVAKVANEIHKHYRDISLEDCKKIAALTFPINDKVNNDDKFDRLFKIMLYIGKDHSEFDHVFNDCFDVYMKGLTSEKNKDLMYELIRFLNNERDTMPAYEEE